MSDEPRDTTEGTAAAAASTDFSHIPSAPWERPRRWSTDALDATRVDDLLAKLGTGDEAPTGRRHRRQAESPEGQSVSASDLIAALSGGQPVAGSSDIRTSDIHTVDIQTGEAKTSEPVSAAVRAPAVPAPAVPAADAPAADMHASEPPVVEAPLPEVPASDASPAAVPTSAAEGTGFAVEAADLPPRIGPNDKAPIRDLGDGPHTDLIPRLTGSVADRAEAESILASLRRQTQSDSTGGAVYGASAFGVPTSDADADRTPAAAATGGGIPPVPPTIPPTGGTGGHGPSDPSPRRRRGLVYASRTIATALAVITLAYVGVAWKIRYNTDAGLDQNSVVSLNTGDPNISSARTAPLTYTNSKGVQTTEAAGTKGTYAPENILLLGSDTRAGKNGDAGNEGAGTSGTANSDTLMVAHISGDRSHVTILSIPRDTLIPAPKCKIWNSSTGVLSDQYQPITPTEIYHINSAYSVGGPACTVTAVQSLTHLGITRVIGIDFSGFQAMVDALGGIELNICRPIIDRVLQTIVPTAGVQKILGAQALNLVRARDVIGDTLSDLARITRQQKVLSAILRQVTQAGTLLNPVKLNNFLQAFTKNTFTTNVHLEDLITLAGSLGSLDPAHVTFYTLPTVPSTTIDGALDVDQTKAPSIFDDLINDLPLPGEIPAPSASKAPSTPTPTPTPAVPNLKLTVAPAKVKLEIYNVTGQANVATGAQQKLDAVGFNVSDNALFKPDSATQTGSTVLFSAPNQAAALTVAAAVPGSTLVLTPGLGTTVRLNLGSSYAGVVNAVKVGDTAPSSLATVSTGPSISTAAASGSTSAAAPSSVNAAANSCL